jgi:endonuclease/exonuclease/phosphatase family metal-dependent hydrolase
MGMQAAETKKKSRTNWFVLSLNSIACVGILLTYAAAAFSPSAMGYLALFGLAYPFILAINLLFVVYWLFKKRRNALLSAGLIILGWNHFTDFFQFSTKGAVNPDATLLKVLTYNVHVFDVFDKTDGATTRDAIYDVLQREQADVVCFQEFYQCEKKNSFPTRDTLLKFLPTKYYHERYTHAISGQQYFGVVTLTKYPIVKKGFVPFATDVNNFCIYIDILKEGDTVRVYNAHLQSIRFKPEDYDLAKGKTEQSEIDDAGKRIARRLKNAFVKRQEQTDRIAESIRACQYPVILCGDFNDPPVSYTYCTLTEQLKDSFKACGNGIGNTYIGAFPSFRIDYILHDEKLEAIDYETLPEKLSDHHAVTATFQWKPKKKKT